MPRWDDSSFMDVARVGFGLDRNAAMWLSLLGLYSALRGLSQGNPVFPLHQKPKFDFSCSDLL